MNGNPQRRRVLMLGVDAAELSFIRAALPSLPTFARLLDQGTLFPLRSTAEFMSASVWPSMYTGAAPGDHGISQHIQWDPAGMRMRRIADDWIYCEPFWYDLARAGLGVTVADVPFTFDNRLPSVTEVANWGSHDLMGRFSATTPALRRAIRRRYGRHPMGYEIPVNKDAGQLRRMRDAMVAGARLKGALAAWLRDTTRWDFFLVVFGECHRAGHILWRDDDVAHAHVPPGALLDVYRAVDEALGVVLGAVDTATTTVVVFGLHGMGANYGQDHFVRRAMDRINRTAVATGARQRGIVRLLREGVPARLQHAIAHAVPVQVHSPELGTIDAMPETGRTGEHRPQGFAVVLGPATRDGGLPPLAHNQDFPRFVAHLLGVRRP